MLACGLRPLENMTGSDSGLVEPIILTVGILEIQGAFLEHKVSLQKAKDMLDCAITLCISEVRTAEHLTDDLDGLIIPGGESTTISIYLRRNKMDEPLRRWISNKKHVTWGTCAGMILLSKITENQKTGGQFSLDIMDIDVSRNFFGRQVQSFETDVQIVDKSLQEVARKITFPGVFIRAPAILKILAPDVKVLATLRVANCETDIIVAAQQDHVFCTAFHPELVEDCCWHLYFLRQLLARKVRGQ